MIIVDIPSFDVFIQSIDGDALAEQLEAQIGQEIVQVVDGLDNPKNVEALLNVAVRFATTAAVKISNIQLRLYHEWLRKSLVQNHGQEKA